MTSAEQPPSAGLPEFLQESPYGAVVVGPDFRFKSVNDAFCRMLEYPEDDLVGRRGMADVTHPEDVAASREQLARLRPDGLDYFVVQKRYVTRSGRVIHALTFVRGLFDPGGGLTGVEASIVDITAKAQAEAALRSSETRYRTLFETANDAIFLVQDGRFVDCNARTLEIFGCSRETILGRHPSAFSPPRQPDGAPSDSAAEAWMSKALAGEPLSFEWLHCRADGTPFDAEVSLARVELGDRFFLQAIVRDRTERKAAERGRLELERRLLHAQKLESLGVLAGGVAHDFNNLLMAMLGNLELALQDVPPGTPARPRLEAVGVAARRAAELTRQMLAYSGRGRFATARLDLNGLVSENLHLLRASVPATTALDVRLGCGIPAIEADAGQVGQVLSNLATNAAEAIGPEPGRITLSTGVLDCDAAYLRRTRLEDAPPPGRYVYLEVADTGCGMDEQTQSQMFDPFFSTKFIGRGLGLPAVLGIVRGHGGAILLETAAGKGAVVRVLFPALEAAPGTAGPAKAAPAGGAGPEQRPAP
jgi:two-component system, cell cycle sensor histidine kinase and response regulator CckA